MVALLSASDYADTQRTLWSHEPLVEPSSCQYATSGFAEVLASAGAISAVRCQIHTGPTLSKGYKPPGARQSYSATSDLPEVWASAGSNSAAR